MKQPQRFRALVLCAGLGLRLRPLTRAVPKPLLEVLDRPLLLHTLAALERAGCEAVAINLHHLGERIRDRVGDHYGDMPVVYSEEAERLGTLGALHPLRGFFADVEAIVIVNGDSLCRWPLRQLLQRHRSRSAEATLLLSRQASTARFGGVAIDSDGFVRAFPGQPAGEATRSYVFAGAHVLSPSLLNEVPAEPADSVIDLYGPMVIAGRSLQALVTRRPWNDLGTPRRYLEAVLRSARGRGPARIWRRGWRSPESRIAASASVRESVVGAGAAVAEGSKLRRCLISSGASVGTRCDLEGVIVASGVELPAGTRVRGRLITNLSSGRESAAQDSVVGDLVYTPL